MYRDVELCCMLKTNITLSNILKFKKIFFKDWEAVLQEKTLSAEEIRKDVEGMAFVPRPEVGVIWVCRYAERNKKQRNNLYWEYQGVHLNISSTKWSSKVGKICWIRKGLVVMLWWVVLDLLCLGFLQGQWRFLARKTHDQINLATTCRWEKVWRLKIVAVVFWTLEIHEFKSVCAQTVRLPQVLCPNYFKSSPSTILLTTYYESGNANALQASSPPPHNYTVSESSLTEEMKALTRSGKLDKISQAYTS